MHPYTYNTAKSNVTSFLCMLLIIKKNPRWRNKNWDGGSLVFYLFIPMYILVCNITHSGGMQEWVIQIPSIPILASVLFI